MNNLKFERIALQDARKDSENKLVSTFVLQPLARGFGITLGNSLRRVLLSSIPGAALVNVEIKGVQHEFSTIDGVFEDVVAIILNLKDIIFKVEDSDPDFQCELELKVNNKELVLASDFRLPAGVEVINQDKIICHLNPGTNFELTATLKKGVGYVSNVENKKIDDRIGVIAIDSIYNPVVRCAYNVEKLQGDKDKLIIEVETNGAIEASKAISLASAMLIEHLEVIKNISEDAQYNSFFEEEVEKEDELDHNIELSKLDLPVRVYNALARAGIKTIGQLIENHKEGGVLKIRSLGKKSYKILMDTLEQLGIVLPASNSDDFHEDNEDFEYDEENFDTIKEEEVEE